MKNAIKVTPFIVLTALFGYNQIALADWTENLKVGGDLRYRYESIDDDTKEGARTRNRYRARIGIKAKANDNVALGFTLATAGTSAPYSNNQTLENGAIARGLNVNQAYFKWHPQGNKSWSVLGGKFKNPFYVPIKSELVFDSDIRPEGIAAQYKNNLMFFNAGFLPMEHIKPGSKGSNAEDNINLTGIQAGIKTKMSGLKFAAGFALYNLDLQGQKSFTNSGSFTGNSNNGTVYTYGYAMQNIFVELGTKIGSQKVTFFADFVTNSDADAEDQGSSYGFKIGKVKKPGSMDFRYLYKEVEKDAVIGFMTDSDFRGDGTDGKGHEINFGYGIEKGWKFGLTYFINKKGITNGTDYNRLQADLKFKF